MTNALTLNAPVDTLAMEFTREFDAPIAALYRAHADADLVKRWLGPHGLEMTVQEWEFRSHGGYRYTHTDEHGTYVFNGTFHTVRENELIVQTFEFGARPTWSTSNTCGSTISATDGHAYVAARSARAPKRGTRCCPPVWKAGCPRATTSWTRCCRSCEHPAHEVTPTGRGPSRDHQNGKSSSA
ncbi:SRPBCC domain-containing protein [Mycolicibacterium vaccae]|nr:SRPBCC domain-containing protein [Mycolicibacterium vaccae]